MLETEIGAPAGTVTIAGTLAVAEPARGIVVFVHGSGSSRHSVRNRRVAQELQRAGLATLLIDLLTEDEERVDLRAAALRFDIALLAERVVAATTWLGTDARTRGLPVGYFGASTGAAAALVAAAEVPDAVGAIVSRGGRPDLAGDALERVGAPTLLIVGGNDVPVIAMNEGAEARLVAPSRLEIVPGASHLFEEPGTLDRVAALARGWFADHLSRAAAPR